MFKDRQEAGERLALLLEDYKNHPDTLVLGLPRGGVVVASEVAKFLKLPLDLICLAKIGAPDNPEYAIGAITETGEAVLNHSAIERLDISKEELDRSLANAFQKAQNYSKILRRKKGPFEVKNRSVIIVDDGMATGLTIEAAIKSLRKQKATEIIVAVPVAPLEGARRIETLANAFFCLSTPSFFYAISPFYENFEQVTSEEVIELLESGE